MGSEGRLVTADNVQELAEWCGGKVVTEIDPIDETVRTPAINVRVESGEIQRARPGVMILRSHEGHFSIFT